jgi:DNA (cytosine-5)-methyltransferase 1
MIDMFAGMGNMRLGFEQAGWKCVYSIEFDKHKREIYKTIYGKEPEGGDITKLNGANIPDAELWAFGAPCQDFSIAGKRAGLDGDRSGLVREVFRLVREKEPNDRPEWLLYENVKGMLSSNGGWDFAAIQAEMGELGYDVQWQLLNSKNFGVPQNRERVYTLGHLRTKGERKVFPIRENDGIIAETEGNRLSSAQVTGALTSTDFKQHGDGTYIVEPSVIQIGNINPDSDDFKNRSAGRVYDQDGLSPTLNTMQGGQRQPMVMTLNTKNANGKEPPQQDRVYSTDGLMTAIPAQLSGRFNIAEPCACLTPDRIEKRQNGRRFKEPGEPMFTLTKQDIHGVALFDMYNHKQITNGICGTITADGNTSATHCGTFGVAIKQATEKGYDMANVGDSINLTMPNSKTRRGRVGKGVAQTLDTQCNQATIDNMRIRRLTPRECMRLQGVPDSVTDKIIQAGISDTQMYRAAGDAVTVNVIQAIAERIIAKNE